jgi:hypothetical protein
MLVFLFVLFLGYWILFLDYLNASESWLQIGQLEYYILATLEITFIPYPGFIDNFFEFSLLVSVQKLLKEKFYSLTCMTTKVFTSFSETSLLAWSTQK